MSLVEQRPARVISTFLSVTCMAVMLAACTTDEPPAVPPPSSGADTEASEAVPPFESADGFVWLTAACGGPAVVDASPNSWLPGAAPVALCVTAPGRPSVLVGIYDDPSTSAADMQGIKGQHGYASRLADDGRTWVFVVEAADPAPLAPLERFQFIPS